MVRSAGLYPVAPPVRLGANYVVRAVDRYGTAMRVLVDGYDGEILAARRIASLYPRGLPPDPYTEPREIAPGYRPYPPGMPRPGASPPEVQRAAPEVPFADEPPPRRTATIPVPRARPAAGSPAEIAAAGRPALEPVPAAAVPEQADQTGQPARQVFRPVQPLE